MGFGLPHSTSQYSTKVIRSSEIIIHDLRLCKQQISRRECQCLATTCSYSLRYSVVSHGMLYMYIVATEIQVITSIFKSFNDFTALLFIVIVKSTKYVARIIFPFCPCFSSLSSPSSS